MWPSFESRPGDPHTVEQLIERANATIKLPGIGAIVVSALAGLIVAAIVRTRVATDLDSWHRFLPAMVTFGSLALGFALAWMWHSLTAPRWWDWAVATGVDLDELVAAASAAGLISRRETWWQGRPSTQRARRRAPLDSSPEATTSS